MRRLGQGDHVCAYRLKSGRFVGLDKPGVPSYGGLTPADYYLYFRLPLVELDCELPLQAFGYLLRESNGATWYSLGKQPLRFGDIVTYNTLAFMLKPLPFCSDDYMSVPSWPDIGLDPYITRRT